MTNQEKALVGYFQSWSEINSSDPAKLQLANLASYVNWVVVSFMKPDSTYKGNYDLSDTGLFTHPMGASPDSGKVIRDAIALLKQKNPKTKVLVSIGGDYYQNFAQLNPSAIAAVVKDFGFDGVDIDYLPNDKEANCSVKNGVVSCGSDSEYRRIVRELRKALPRPTILTLTGWSVGAYGEDKWKNAQPANGPWMGLLLDLMRSPEAADLDQLHVTSYNGGLTYNPKEALDAYQHYFKGRIVMAVHVPPEAWPSEASIRHVYTLPKVRELAQAVVKQNAAGIMIWSLQRQIDQTPSEDYPDAQMMAREICRVLSLGNCEQPLFSH